MYTLLLDGQRIRGVCTRPAQRSRLYKKQLYLLFLFSIFHSRHIRILFIYFISYLLGYLTLFLPTGLDAGPRWVSRDIVCLELQRLPGGLIPHIVWLLFLLLLLLLLLVFGVCRVADQAQMKFLYESQLEVYIHLKYVHTLSNRTACRPVVWTSALRPPRDPLSSSNSSSKGDTSSSRDSGLSTVTRSTPLLWLWGERSPPLLKTTRWIPDFHPDHMV